MLQNAVFIVTTVRKIIGYAGFTHTTVAVKQLIAETKHLCLGFGNKNSVYLLQRFGIVPHIVAVKKEDVLAA